MIEYYPSIIIIVLYLGIQPNNKRLHWIAFVCFVQITKVVLPSFLLDQSSSNPIQSCPIEGLNAHGSEQKRKPLRFRSNWFVKPLVRSCSYKLIDLILDVDPSSDQRCRFCSSHSITKRLLLIIDSICGLDNNARKPVHSRILYMFQVWSESMEEDTVHQLHALGEGTSHLISQWNPRSGTESCRKAEAE